MNEIVFENLELNEYLKWYTEESRAVICSSFIEWLVGEKPNRIQKLTFRRSLGQNTILFYKEKDNILYKIPDGFKTRCNNVYGYTQIMLEKLFREDENSILLAIEVGE